MARLAGLPDGEAMGDMPWPRFFAGLIGTNSGGRKPLLQYLRHLAGVVWSQ